MIKCLSCAMYDPKAVGFFCQLCYDARHPWYRMDHMSIDISLDESIEYTIKVAHRRAEMMRFERDGTDLLASVKTLAPVLDYVGDDLKVEHQLKTAGHTASKLETRIHEFRRSLRQDVRRQGLSVAPNPDEASLLLARVFRGWRVRKSLSMHFLQRLRRVRHPDGSAKAAYLDTRTQRVLAGKPVLLLHAHAPYVQLHESHPSFKAAPSSAPAPDVTALSRAQTEPALRAKAEGRAPSAVSRK